MTDVSRALIGCLIVDLILSLILGYRLMAPNPVVVVPGVREERIAVPGVVPDQALANFALLFALNFENYSTATLETQDRYAQALVSSKFIAGFQKMTAERRAMIREALLASSFFPHLDTVRVHGSTISFRARKQHLIGDRLSWDALFDYEIAVERTHPTQLNPYGLAIENFRALKVDHDR